MWNDPEHQNPENNDSASQETAQHQEPSVDDAFLKSLFADTKPSPSMQQTEKPSHSAWQNRKLWAFLAVSALILCLVCFVVFGGARLADQVIRLVRYSGDETVFTFDAHSANRYASFHDGLAVASVSGLIAYNNNGEETAFLQSQMELPVLLENNTVAMSYSIGGSSICTVHHRKDAHMQLPVNGTLLDADLSAGSCIGYASVQPGYKTVLTALDATGTEIYSWYSSTRFFSQCAVSENAEALAAIALGQTGSSFETSCVLFATDQEQPVAELPLGDDLIYELAFVEKDRLCAVGETSLHFFGAEGSGHSQYSFDGGKLLYYDLHADHFAAIVRDMNQAGSRYRITTVDQSGTELASLSTDEEILDISANGQYLAVLTPQSLRVYDSRLRLCLSEDNVGYATQVCVQKDGAALLIDGSTAHRVS